MTKMIQPTYQSSLDKYYTATAMVQSEKHEYGVQQCIPDNTIATVNKFASWFKLVCFLEVSLQFAEEAEVTGACFHYITDAGCCEITVAKFSGSAGESNLSMSDTH